MKRKLIALTGGIGSGKSTVLNALALAGFKTISSDKVVSDLYKKPKIKRLIKSRFPQVVDGKVFLSINKVKLAQTVFNDNDKLNELTSLITPLVLKEILKIYKKSIQPLIAEVPILFECEYQSYFDGVIVIKRNVKDRIESVKTRSNLTDEQIIKRINAQVNYDNIDLSAYTVIINDSDASTLSRVAIQAVKTLLEN